MTTIDPAAAAAADTIAQFEGPSERRRHDAALAAQPPARQPDAGPGPRCVYFSLFTERFFTATNLSTILAQVTIIGTLAVAQTLVILTAGIDLSVGSITVLSSVVMGKLAFGWGYQPVLALLIGIVVGTACGLLNGGAGHATADPAVHRHARARSTPCSPSASGSPRTRRCATRTSRPRRRSCCGSTTRGSRSSGFRVTYGSLLMLVLFVVAWYVLRRTAWGRHVYATGDDREAARLVGIRTDRVLHVRVRRQRADLRHRRVVVDQPHRHGVPEAAGERQPRLDHRRGDRRHEPVRRERQRVRLVARCPHRRRVRQRPLPGRASSRCGGRSPSACSSSSPSRSTSGSEGSQREHRGTDRRRSSRRRRRPCSPPAA